MKRITVIVSLLSVLFASCASNPPKQAALQGESALAAVRELTKAYEKRDLEAFMDKVSINYPDRDGFQKSLQQIFSTYQTIRFSVQETRMLIMVQYQGSIKAVFTWEGEWQTSGGKIGKDGGRVTLVLDPGAYKLLAVEGKNPYLPVETAMPVK